MIGLGRRGSRQGDDCGHGLLCGCLGGGTSAGRDRGPHRRNRFGARGVTALRLEGVAPSVAHRKSCWRGSAGALRHVDTLGAAASRALWRAVRDVAPFAAKRDPRSTATGSASLSRGTTLRLAHLDGAVPRRRDRRARSSRAPAPRSSTIGPVASSGLRVTVSDGRAGVRSCARRVAAAGGHATLVRAPARRVRAKVDVFEPETRPGLRIDEQRVREGFDPRGVLNPGRMWAGV